MIRITKYLITILLSTLFVGPVFSEESAEGGATTEATASESADGEAKEGDAAEAAPKEVIEDQAYQKLITRMNTLEGSIKDTKGQIRSLIHMSKSSGNVKVGEDGSTVSSEIQRLQKLLKTQTSDYNEKRLELKYRYPSQGVILERRYLPMGNKTLEEIEGEVGIEGSLSRVRAVIKKKYKEFMPKDEAESHALQEKKSFEKKRNKKLRLEK